MAFETYPKNGQKGSRHVFSGEESKAGWDDTNTERRDYMKSGTSPVVRKGMSSEKFQQGKESPGNTSRREYPKKGHSATKFGSTKMQGS
jgi:hypothetical protein